MRNKSILIVANCILNPHAQVYSKNRENLDLKELLDWVYENQIGIMQLPCPETYIYGLRRWGHVREQFNNKFFKKTSKKILKPFLSQLIEYVNNGYKIIGILGVNGSPSCGIDFSCSSTTWMGEISSIDSIEKKLNELEYVEKKGIFMKIFYKLINEYNITMYGLQKDNILEVLEKLKESHKSMPK